MSETHNPPLKDVSGQPEFNTVEFVLEELVAMFDEARAAGRPDISSCVGSRFEARVRLVCAALTAPTKAGEME